MDKRKFLVRDDAQDIWDEYEKTVRTIRADMEIGDETTPATLLKIQTDIILETELRMLACRLREIEVLDEIKCEISNYISEFRSQR